MLKLTGVYLGNGVEFCKREEQGREDCVDLGLFLKNPPGHMQKGLKSKYYS